MAFVTLRVFVPQWGWLPLDAFHDVVQSGFILMAIIYFLAGLVSSRRKVKHKDEVKVGAEEAP